MCMCWCWGVCVNIIYVFYTQIYTLNPTGIEVNDFLSLSDTFLDLSPPDQPPGSPELIEFPENLKLTPYTPCFTKGGIADTATCR